MLDEADIDVECGEIVLEGRFHVADGPLAAVVLHPHPQYGGDMHNHVVMAICEEAAQAGMSALRLNFRGVGRSSGLYGGGSGEAEDARAAVAAVREAAPGARVLLAGYSFGAMVASAVADDIGAAALLLVSPPLAMGDVRLPDGVPVLIVTGERDAISPAETALALARDGVAVVTVPGADHGWWPGVEELRDACGGFIRALAGTAPRGAS